MHFKANLKNGSQWFSSIFIRKKNLENCTSDINFKTMLFHLEVPIFIFKPGARI
jgi:hypothetical protein